MCRLYVPLARGTKSLEWGMAPMRQWQPAITMRRSKASLAGLCPPPSELGAADCGLLAFEGLLV